MRSFHKYSVFLFTSLVIGLLLLSLGSTLIRAEQVGNVVAFGANRFGSLGIGTTDFDPHPVPVQVNINDVISAAAGNESSFAVKSDGTLWAWGDNSLGQLGDNTQTNRTSPVEVVDSDGIGNFSNVLTVSSNSFHTLALKNDGSVWAWGSNNQGELGDGTNISKSSPVQVKGPGGVGTLSSVVAIDTGDGFSVVLKSDGTVWAWGINNHGQLGDNSTTSRFTPVQVVGSDGSGSLTGVIAISAGDAFNLALKSDGTVWAWGQNANGQLGDGTQAERHVPVQVVGPDGNGNLTGIDAISTGRMHGLALKNDGTVWSWGFNDYGALGIGDVFPTYGLTPIQVKDPIGTSFLMNVTAIYAGGERSFVVTQDKRVWGWGEAVLGDGSVDPHYLPTEAAGLYGAISISTGYLHSLALVPAMSTPTPTNQPPTASAGGPYTVPEGGSVTLNGSGYDPDGDPTTFIWDLDNNGTFETAGQSATFSAVGRAAPSAQTVVLQVCDNKGACATSRVSVNIISAVRIVTDSPLPSGMVGVPYSVTLQATGGTPPYAWSIASGSLPPGLILDASTGAISGTPTAAGTFGFTVQVRDSSGTTASGNFGMAPPPPNGNAGDEYEVPIVITPPDDGGGGGGTSTCSNYSIVAGTLPPGLSLDPTTGIISGAPTDGGAYTFTVGCTISGGSSQGQTATKEFTITIYNPDPRITSLDPDSTRAEDPSFTLVVNGTNFVQSSVVYWNGVARLTAYVSATRLRAQISDTDIATQGTANLTIVNPDPGGGTSNAVTFTILPANKPPTASPGGHYSVPEGGSITLDGSGSFDPDGDLLTYVWDLNSDGVFETNGATPSFSAAERDGPDSQTVGLRVCDDDDACDEASATIEITNANPVIASLSNDGPVEEGSSATVQVTASDAAGTADPLSYEFDCDDDGSYESGPQVSSTAICVFADDGAFQVNVRVSDDDGGAGTASTTVTVNNAAPALRAISAPLDPIAVSTAIATSADFTDPGVLDTHTAVWDWGDGTTSAGSVTEANGSGSASGSHTYSAAGIYTVKFTVTDKDSSSADAVFQYVVVYDPNGGFVTGGGWINSPAGAYKEDPGLAGKATIGFVSKYRKGATVPTGVTQFQFQVADLNFHSDSYEWLVVAGAKAQYKGSGTINGSGDYGFMLTAIDGQLNGGGGTDKFRIKIWNKATNAAIYDNQLGANDTADPTTVIGGGSIVIHK